MLKDCCQFPDIWVISRKNPIMARGGIAKGVNPSIDSVRLQLGNTGSKTAIHRYMKELEENEGGRLDDQD